MKNRLSVVFAFMVAMTLSNLSLALEKEPFTMERFEELRLEGAVILVHFYSSRCTTCARQQEILENYRAENPRREFHVLELDLDDNQRMSCGGNTGSESKMSLIRVGEFWCSRTNETRVETITEQLNFVTAIPSGILLPEWYQIPTQ